MLYVPERQISSKNIFAWKQIVIMTQRQERCSPTNSSSRRNVGF